MKKQLATLGMAAAIGIGGLTVAAVNPLQVAGAQDPAAEAPAGANPQRQGPLQRALDQLVADGTLTQEQADAVAEATKAEAQAGRDEWKDTAKPRRAELLAAVAEALGSTPEEVKAALEDGTSIAAQAEAAGVDRQVVDDALTALLTERIDQAVADGRLTEERAAKATDRVDQLVDRMLDADGSGRGDGSWRERFRERRGN